MGLTRLSTLKTFGGIAVATYDGKLNTLIAQVSDRVEKLCDRVFGAATYREFVTGHGTRQIQVSQYPITTLYFLMTGTCAALKIDYSGAATLASVQVDDVGVNLVEIVAGAPQKTACLFSAYATITLTAAAISAVSGWTATVEDSSENGPKPSQLLMPCTGADLSITGTSAFLSIPYQIRNGRIDPLAERTIEMDETIPEGDRVFLWYVAGYTLPSDSSPSDGTLPTGLVLEVNRIIMDVFNASRRDGMLASESIEGYSYSVDPRLVTSIVDAHADALLPYRRLTI